MHPAGSFAFVWLTLHKLLWHAIVMCVSLLLLAGWLFETHVDGITLHIGADRSYWTTFWDKFGLLGAMLSHLGAI